MKNLLLLIFICLGFRAAAISPKDSVLALQQKAATDSMRIEYYKVLANLVADEDSAGAFIYLQQGLTLSRQKKLVAVEIDMLHATGLMHESFENLDAAMRSYNEALMIARHYHMDKEAGASYLNLFFVFKGLGETEKGLRILDTALLFARKSRMQKLTAHILNNRGSERLFKGNYEPAMNDLLEALELYKREGDERSAVATYSNIGNAYNNLKQYDKAIDYLENAIKLGNKTDNMPKVMEAMNNISNSYSYKKEYRKSLEYLQQLSVIHRTKFPYPAAYAAAINNIGSCYKELKMYDSAIYYTEMALPLTEEVNDLFDVAAIHVSLGELYIIRKNYPQSIVHLKKAEQLTQEHHFKEQEKNAYLGLHQYYAQTNQPALSAKYLEAAYKIKDSLEAVDMAERITEMETRFQTQQKEYKIRELNEENKIKELQLSRQKALFILGISCLILVGVTLVQRQRNRRFKDQAKAQEILQQQQQQAAQSIIEAELNERSRIAMELHDGIGQTFSAARMNLSGISNHLSFQQEKYRSVYEKTMTMIDEGCHELRSISHQMLPEVLLKRGLKDALKELVDRTDQKILSVNLHVGRIGIQNVPHIEITIYRIVQEALSNTLKHASAKHMDIQLQEEENTLYLTIEDDGRGFEIQQNSNGIGLKNIHSRILLLKGFVEINSTPDKGTFIALSIPLKNEQTT